MNLKFLVDVDVSHTTGKFAGRDELSEKVKEALEGSDPGSVEGDNGGEYEVQSWSVDEYTEPKPAKPAKVKPAPAPTGVLSDFELQCVQALVLENKGADATDAHVDAARLLVIAFEAGFKAHERGNNYAAALAEFVAPLEPH